MPRLDRTGPFGTGPIGRGQGPCVKNTFFSRYGRGLNRRMGKMWNLVFPNWPRTREEKLEFLSGYKKRLKEELQTVKEEEKKL